MLQRIFVFIFLFHLSFLLTAQDYSDSTKIFQRLEYLMENQKMYVKNREDKLDKLKQEAKALEADQIRFLRRIMKFLRTIKSSIPMLHLPISHFAKN